MLELRQVAKDYGEPGSPGYVHVLEDVSLMVTPGQAVAVVGPSGSGKSTLLNLMGALDRPTRGQVLFDGQDLTGLDDTQLATIRCEDIGFVFQLHHLLPQCTVLENILIPTLAHAASESQDIIRERALDLLAKVGLVDQRDRRPGQLSGGQQQRVAVARALINRPKLLLADEPTGSLDGHTAGVIGDLLVQLNRSEQVALVVVTHATALAERFDQVWELSNGHLKQRNGS
jgi:ABC-type lipoprotein export system ATPase subunit